MAKKDETLSDNIRRLIADCGLSQYELGKLSGVDKAALGRFMSGERGLNTKSLDRLASVLGWKIVGGKKLTPKK